MFCTYCGAEVTNPSHAFCTRCGKRLPPPSAGVAPNDAPPDELSFVDPHHSPEYMPAAAQPPARPVVPWNSAPLRCAPYTFGPHMYKYKMHGTCNAPEGKLSGDLALTLTGFEFISKGWDIRIYYGDIVRAEKTSSSTIAIVTADGNTYDFKVAVPKAWIEKIEDMSR
ncbi:MAG: hypothetical protein JW839_22715 [Candidatus Lokiarchaeota archaeon]|nr:hypothetical protein [Candidatus Lokiarchaeota archaeon]